MLLFWLQILRYAATACVNGKVSVSSNNHMMHPLTITVMADSFKRISGVRPSEAVRFFQSKGFKVP